MNPARRDAARIATTVCDRATAAGSNGAARTPSRSARTVLGWATVRVAAIVGVLVALTACEVPGVPTESILASEFRTGGNVVLDASLDTDFPLGPVPSDELVAFATCHNALRWEANSSLDFRVVVLRQAWHIRIAELLRNDTISETDAQLFFTAWVRGLSVESTINRYNPPASVARGLREAPSREALDRFVAYVSSRSLSQQRVVLVDSQAGDFEWSDRLSEQESIFTVGIAGRGSTAVTSEQCEEIG